jgi:hypothetical protein
VRTALLITLVSSLLPAAPISDLFNTGATGVDQTDLHWTVDGKQAYVTPTSQFPFPAWQVGTDAGWVSPQADYTASSDDADTTFIFATVFNLPAQFQSAYIIMQVATDNALEDVKLNGVSLNIAKSNVDLNRQSISAIVEGTGFSSGLGAPLSVLSGFRPGENKLEFHVRNSATNVLNEGNPTGMIAAFNSDVTRGNSDVSDSPEPASLVFFCLGLAFFGLVAAIRSNKHAVTR